MLAEGRIDGNESFRGVDEESDIKFQHALSAFGRRQSTAASAAVILYSV